MNDLAYLIMFLAGTALIAAAVRAARVELAKATRRPRLVSAGSGDGQVEVWQDKSAYMECDDCGYHATVAVSRSQRCPSCGSRPRASFTGGVRSWWYAYQVPGGEHDSFGPYSSEEEAIAGARRVVSLVVDGAQDDHLPTHTTGNESPRSATITYSLPAEGEVKLTIYTLSGHKMRTLVDETVAAGPQSATWDGCDDAGKALPAGTYYYELVADGQEIEWGKTIVLT